MSRDRFKAIMEYISEQTMEMGTEEYVDFMHELADWCREKAEIADYHDSEWIEDDRYDD